MRDDIPPPSRQGPNAARIPRDPKRVRRCKCCAVTGTGRPPVGSGVDHGVPISDRLSLEMGLI
jgi:hypothetical protein